MPTTPRQFSSRPIKFARLELLVAAGAAARWPPGRNSYCWFTEDCVEKEWTAVYRIPVNVARKYGDPAVALAALRAATAGRNWIDWPDVWRVQTVLLKLLESHGVKLYNDLLSEDPLHVSEIFKELAKEVK